MRTAAIVLAIGLIVAIIIVIEHYASILDPPRAALQVQKVPDAP
jgi:hypothetical protein